MLTKYENFAVTARWKYSRGVGKDCYRLRRDTNFFSIRILDFNCVKMGRLRVMVQMLGAVDAQRQCLKILCVFCFAISCCTTFAQTVELYGKVSAKGNPLVYCTVKVGAQATVTDAGGVFRIIVPLKSLHTKQILVSRIGFASVSSLILSNKFEYNFSMKEILDTLGNVTVTNTAWLLIKKAWENRRLNHNVCGRSIKVAGKLDFAIGDAYQFSDSATTLVSYRCEADRGTKARSWMLDHRPTLFSAPRFDTTSAVRFVGYHLDFTRLDAVLEPHDFMMPAYQSDFRYWIDSTFHTDEGASVVRVGFESRRRPKGATYAKVSGWIDLDSASNAYTALAIEYIDKKPRKVNFLLNSLVVIRLSYRKAGDTWQLQNAKQQNLAYSPRHQLPVTVNSNWSLIASLSDTFSMIAKERRLYEDDVSQSLNFTNCPVGSAVPPIAFNSTTAVNTDSANAGQLSPKFNLAKKISAVGFGLGSSAFQFLQADEWYNKFTLNQNILFSLSQKSALALDVVFNVPAKKTSAVASSFKYYYRLRSPSPKRLIPAVSAGPGLAILQNRNIASGLTAVGGVTITAHLDYYITRQKVVSFNVGFNQWFSKPSIAAANRVVFSLIYSKFR